MTTNEFINNLTNAIHLLEERVSILEKKYNRLQHVESDILDLKRELEAKEK